MEKRVVKHNGATIPFILHRKKVKNINIRIRPDTTVVVSAGGQVPYEKIEHVVIEKAAWIIHHVGRFEEARAVSGKREFIAGEIIEYLGRRYPLQVVRVENGEEVIFDGGEFRFYIKDEADYSLKEALFKNWSKKQAVLVFNCSLDRIYPLVTGDDIEKPSLTIRTMKTRWGSCTPHKRKITLNAELLKTPPACIDYVVLHELTHFRHRRHDAAFYSYLAGRMPDWKDRRAILKQYNLY